MTGKDHANESNNKEFPFCQIEQLSINWEDTV